MALKPIDEAHALQIQAGTLGRRKGHDFENALTKQINVFVCPYSVPEAAANCHIFVGVPSRYLIDYVCQREGLSKLVKVSALSTGALATDEGGKHLLSHEGIDIRRCKSDLLLILHLEKGAALTVGVSIKQCDTKSPTNAQLFCSTASAFAKMLRDNGIPVSDATEVALKQFCGEVGHTPADNEATATGRTIDPRRFFWEELPDTVRIELADVLKNQHNTIFRLLLEKAYSEDTFPPKYVVHKTKRASSDGRTEVAIYSFDELIALSALYRGFETREYRVRKGSYRDPEGVTHLAPRFGIVQMQRLGNKQNATQLQFNLEAGYFYSLAKHLEQMATNSGGKQGRHCVADARSDGTEVSTEPE